MWEKSRFRQTKSLNYTEFIDDFSNLENFTEQELLELLQSLENDEMISDIETQLGVQDYNDILNEAFANETTNDDNTNQRQKQEQSQQVLAEIHTHNHYYLIQKQDGTIQVSRLLSHFKLVRCDSISRISIVRWLVG